MTYYLLKPCRTATAFISTLKQARRVDLGAAAERLRLKGWVVNDMKVMLILDGEPQDEDSTRFELRLRDFVDLAEVLHLLLDDLPPGVELELPHARPIDLPQEPVSPQLGDVVDLESGLREVHPDFGEFLHRVVSAPEERAPGEQVLEVVVGLVDDLV